jgi:phosphohistidine phosphatase
MNTMRLYLIRHAEAEPQDEGGGEPDAERRLTEVGHAQSKVVAAGLQRRGVRLNALVTSPLVRAHQTAEDVRHESEEPEPELIVCEDLAPGGRRKRIARFLGGLEGDAVGVVGHMPDLAEFAGWLIGSRKVGIDLAKAGVACIDCPEGAGKGAGSLVWLVTPEWLSESPSQSARGSSPRVRE